MTRARDHERRSAGEPHPGPPVSRRAFLAGSVGMVLLGMAPAPPALRIALLLPGAGPARESVRRGFRLGGEESGHTASLLGTVLDAVEVEGEATPGLTALLGGWDEASARAGAALARAAGAVFLNVGADADSLRGCGEMLHVVPSRSMRPPGALAWHPALERYGAAQLNARFAERFQAPMDEPAWCAWAAVKLAVETALRAGDRARVGPALLSASLRFDGHKGMPLRFDPASGQLVQPLYLLRGQEPVEVDPLPVRPVAC
jgi:hypothetical protein